MVESHAMSHMKNNVLTDRPTIKVKYQIKRMSFEKNQNIKLVIATVTADQDFPLFVKNH